MEDAAKDLQQRQNLNSPDIDGERESCESPHEEGALPLSRVVRWIVENNESLDLFRHQ